MLSRPTILERVEYMLKVGILLAQIFEIPGKSIPASVSTARIRNFTSLHFVGAIMGCPWTEIS